MVHGFESSQTKCEKNKIRKLVFRCAHVFILGLRFSCYFSYVSTTIQIFLYFFPSISHRLLVWNGRLKNSELSASQPKILFVSSVNVTSLQAKQNAYNQKKGQPKNEQRAIQQRNTLTKKFCLISFLLPLFFQSNTKNGKKLNWY